MKKTTQNEKIMLNDKYGGNIILKVLYKHLINNLKQYQVENYSSISLNFI